MWAGWLVGDSQKLPVTCSPAGNNVWQEHFRYFQITGKIVSDIDQIVQDILADMSLKEKAAIANLDEGKVPWLRYAFDTCIRSQTGNHDEMAKDI